MTLPSNCSCTVPIGPWRCLPMMTSALPLTMLHLGHPVLELGRAFRRLGALNIILLAVHEHDDVGVLLDRARFAQVRELRPLVLAVLDRARELRQRDDRHVQLLGQRLEAGGDLRHLLHAAFVARLGRARQQLQVVDDEQAEALLALEPARAGRELGDRDAAGLVDVERQRGHLLAGLDQALELGLVDHAAADLLRGDAGLLGEDAGGELLGRHFEREEADDRAVVAGIVGSQVRLLAAATAHARGRR